MIYSYSSFKESLLSGAFKKRTNKQRSALVQFWRNRDNLSLHGGMLCFNGKRVVKKEVLHNVLKRCISRLKDQVPEKSITNLRAVVAALGSETSRKCLPNYLSTKGSTFALKTTPSTNPCPQRLRTKHKGKTDKYVLGPLSTCSAGATG